MYYAEKCNFCQNRTEFGECKLMAYCSGPYQICASGTANTTYPNQFSATNTTPLPDEIEINGIKYIKKEI